MWEKRLSAFFAGLNAVIAAKLTDWLVSSNVGVTIPIALILAGLVAAISQSLLEILFFELPLKFRYTRRLIDPVSRVEGYWLEEICATDNSCHFSYACIQYEAPGKYQYYGSSFMPPPDFELKAHFRAEADQIQIEGNQHKVTMRYYFTAQLYPTQKPPEGLNVRGYGVLTFFSDGSPQFNRGDGFFIDDSGVSVNELRLNLTRIPDKLIQEINEENHHPAKYRAFTNDEIKQLVQATIKPGKRASNS